MAKLHLEGGVTFEGTPEEIKAYTDLYVVDAEKTQEAPSFKEGDIVVITGNTNKSLNAVGDIGKITWYDEYEPAGGYVEVPNGATHSIFTLSSEMRHATQAEREQYEEALKPKLKAGDWVKFTEDGTDITAGKVYEIKANADGDLYFLDDEGDDRTYPISGDSDYQFEIAKAPKPPTAFERIGRKEGEFKIGDIVRVITGEFTLFEPGTIGELVSGAHFICPRKFGVKHGDTTQDCYDDFELIAPVESRVDAN